ncbi:MAG TPA: RNA methyltransferase [bacterium]|nr:RNA methyltransferase [bacterium]
MNPHPRTLDDLRERLADAGARPVHAQRLVRAWLGGRSFEEPVRPRTPQRGTTLQEALPALWEGLDLLVREVSRHPAPDGSCRRLLRLGSGRTVESVDLPRAGLCVSTQVGCAVGCRFCRTGEDGLLQQLSPLEILAQVVAARRERPVRRVVFMGMGEPAHNLSAVLEAITALGEEGGLAHKNLVFSTVGDPAVFRRLAAARVRPGLAISLHTLDADRRRELLPRAPAADPEDLLAAGLEYADRTTYPLLVQWTLLEGVNDTVDEARALAARLRGRRAVVNYIPFNSVEGSGFRRPPIARCVELVRTVKAEGVRGTLRLSAGQDVDAGCGQLRARIEGARLEGARS